ncbi:hypothetical protein MMC13_003756 [Lambiella insularis]|nr:hypothetical protein [Lambiella insularis]
MTSKRDAHAQQPQPTAKLRPQTEFETAYRDWTFLIPRQNSRFHIVETWKLFKAGWDLMSKDHTEIRQHIIKKLASEEGLATIKALVDGMVGRIELQSRLHMFKDETLPFFRIISHPDVLSSFILETPLDTIYTFLFGPNSRRALEVFKASTSSLATLAWEDTAMDETLPSAAVTATLAVLEKIVDLNQGAQVIAEFTSIVDELSTCIPEQLLEAGSRSLNKIRQRLGIETAMPISKGRRSTNPKGFRPKFELGQDLPGVLSEHGPRHDNDHENIFDIKILPTTEEIQSMRSEYLPSCDSSKHHLPGVAGLLDRQFRLLREDTVGQLRDAVQIEYKRLNNPPQSRPPPQKHSNGIRNIVYHDVALVRLEFDRKKGLQIVADFDQPSALKKKGSKEREEWWKNSKLLQTDAFVCLVCFTGRAIFFRVCDPTPTPALKRRDVENVGAHSNENWRSVKGRPSLFRQAQRATLMLSLVEDSSEDITWITSQLGMARNPGHSLVEFPGILLPSFQPTLQALQQMSRTLDLPFSELLVRSGEDTEDVDIPAPAYSRRPNFSFNLETLVRGDRLRLRPGQPFDYAALRTKSTLDDAQQFSTVYALGRCLALIQGPPGTGKSYTGVALIKALLRNREIAELGPVICVCYTNHALDQLLEHLVEDGVTQLIRLGSRSKSEILQNLDLHHVSMEVKPTRPEGQEKYKLFTRLDTVLDEIDELMSSIKNPSHSSTIKEYLEAYHYGHYQQLFSRATDDHGYQEVRGKKFSVLNSWLKGASKRIVSARAVPELLEANLLEMSSVERLALYKYWIQQSATEANIRLLHSLESYHEIRDLLKRCHQETDLRCLLGAHVIGVTTTGLARNLDVLRRVRAKVIMFEEAGEILEAHTLTALLPSVEHAILIGDHEQLRPQVNNYEFQQENLRGKNPLDISLFERLVRPQPGYPKLPFSSLEVQRRMHPSIAELVRATLYPQLIDHSSVFAYPEVDGMRKRLFWLDHDEKEDSLSSDLAQSFSKTNTWEVEMVAALVTHLVRQGVYRNEDIAVLTPYLGQLQKLKQRLRSSFAIVVGDRDVEELEMKGLEGDSEEETPLAQGNVRKTTLLNALRVATVDNFQGEEAKVIIVSLVRCNDERKCGFLKTSNRINVLLSRARHGMYIIGSTQTARPVPIWNKVITILEEGENIGRTLALRCPRHKETPIEVSKADDFSIFSPEGGCNESRYMNQFGAWSDAIEARKDATIHARRFAETPAIRNERMVDYIMRSTYAEIDLDNNPCIIPSCGHLLTRESMDGHMDMMQYYITSNDENAEESIIAVKTDSVPFSSSDLKNCPLCRIPLRNINRYGRIVRRAWIDEATKKFIVWANSQFVPLASKMEQAEAKLQIPVLDKKTPLLAGQAQLSSSLNKLSLESIRLIGSRDEQLKVIRKADRPEGRYRDVFLLRSAIAKFRKVVDEAEQPISHIYDLIEDARRHRGVETKVADLPSVLQVRHRLLATVLLLRCDYAILRDFVNHSVGAASAGRTADFSLSLARNREDCEALIQDSRARQQPAHELEGLLYWVRFTALERGRSASLSETDMSALIDRAHEQLGLAHNLCKEYPGQTAGMPAEISAAERMVRGDTFYAPVTNAEKAAVYAAMTQEFSGTGHWYNCVNGHPFTVGECGMPMQTARCPQCGAAVGGNHHQPVAGVTRATDMDEFGH